MAQELFDLGHGLAVGFNPGGRHHGWLLRKHPDGQYVTIRKLELIADPFATLDFLSPKVTGSGNANAQSFRDPNT